MIGRSSLRLRLSDSRGQPAKRRLGPGSIRCDLGLARRLMAGPGASSFLSVWHPSRRLRRPGTSRATGALDVAPRDSRRVTASAPGRVCPPGPRRLLQAPYPTGVVNSRRGKPEYWHVRFPPGPKGPKSQARRHAAAAPLARPTRSLRPRDRAAVSPASESCGVSGCY